MEEQTTTTTQYTTSTSSPHYTVHSRNKGTGDDGRNRIINMILQLVCLILGLLLIAIGVLRFFPIVQFTFTGKAETGKLFYTVINIVISIYVIIFGFFISIFSLFFPRFLSIYFGFFRVWWGRGGLFIFIAALILTNSIINVATAVLLLIFGILFVILAFIPVVPPPRPIIDCIATDFN